MTGLLRILNCQPALKPLEVLKLSYCCSPPAEGINKLNSYFRCCVVPRRREDTYRKCNPATDINYSSSPPSLQKGEGQLTPSLTFVQRYERLRESQRRLWVYIPRGYFNPALSFSTKLRLSSSDRQRKTEFLTFIPIMTITTIYTKKYMDINVYSFSHMLVEYELFRKTWADF